MNEFTGERVIPGEVNDDLWAEHIARYALASEYARGGRVLDIGCGTGYGAQSFATTASFVAGIDLSVDAVGYARAHYSRPYFVQASAAHLPFADASFDLVTAFEVIEHLSDWRDLIHQASRVLRPDGLFIVSTPNKLYYAESRANEGPNPFHTHEFEYEEFRDALGAVFPGVWIALQNRVESIVFAPVAATANRSEAQIDGDGGDPEHAHFFLALCSLQVQRELRPFTYVPRAANILRERERHIQLLEDELQKNKRWLGSMTADRDKLLDLYSEQKHQLEEHNLWALQLEKDWKAALERITQVQDELKTEQATALQMSAGYSRKVEELQEENQKRAEWALDVEARFSDQLSRKCAELAEAVRLLDQAEATVVERTRWAQQLQSNAEELQAQLQNIRESRWIKLGRVVGLGPQVKG